MPIVLLSSRVAGPELAGSDHRASSRCGQHAIVHTPIETIRLYREPRVDLPEAAVGKGIPHDDVE